MTGRIIQIRGPSGSGKTTLMRAVMEGLGSPIRVRPKDDPTRRKPSLLAWPQLMVAVVGHYDVLCGGCDTIKHRERPFELARRAADDGYCALLEGLFTSTEFHRTLAIERAGYERHDIFLIPPMSECISNVEARRRSQGKEIIEQRQMAEYYPRMMRTHQRLAEAGLGNLHVFQGPTAQIAVSALDCVRELIRN